MSQPPIVLATTNPAKVERLAWMLKGLPFRTLTADHVVSPPVTEERGDSHCQIAEAKALAWSVASSGLALATDGGIHIPTLGQRWEALLTRRAAGAEVTDEQRAAYLLDLMRDLRGDDRRASWREAAALADRGRLLGSWEVEASEPLRIASASDFTGVPRGFYIPSLLEFPRLGRRFTQLTPDERDQALDHWTQLRDCVRPALEKLRDSGEQG